MAIRICKSFLYIIYMLVAGHAFARQQEVVAMEIPGMRINASEVLYAYQKSNADKNQLKLKDFAENYLDFKLKICYALKHQMDTLPEIKDEYASFEYAVLHETLTDSAFLDSLRVSPKWKQEGQSPDQERILIADIHIPVLQKNPDVYSDSKRADSIYSSLMHQKGEDKTLSYTIDTLCIDQYDVLPSFFNHLLKMEEGIWSVPFAVEDGYHIVKVISKMPSAFNTLKDVFPDKTGSDDNNRMLALQAGLKRLYSHYGLCLSPDNFREAIAKVLPQVDFQLKECKDNLLAYEATRFFRDSVGAVADDPVLLNHFKKYKKRFRWNSPRFKGVMVVAPDRHLANKAIKIASRCTNEEAARIALRKICSLEETKSVAIRYGIFQNGDDEYIDEKIFGISSSSNPDTKYHKAIYGKVLKRPKTYHDDEDSVRQDYIALQESLWRQSLRHEYPHSIHWDVINQYQ